MRCQLLERLKLVVVVGGAAAAAAAAVGAAVLGEANLLRASSASAISRCLAACRSSIDLFHSGMSSVPDEVVGLASPPPLANEVVVVVRDAKLLVVLAASDLNFDSERAETSSERLF